MSMVIGGMSGAVVSAARTATRTLFHTVNPAGARSSPADGEPDDPSQWGVVIVDLPQEQVLPAGRWPNPLAVWGDAIEVQVRPAPGAKGSELYARLRDPRSDAAPEGLDGETPSQKLRTTLKRSKQLLET